MVIKRKQREEIKRVRGKKVQILAHARAQKKLFTYIRLEENFANLFLAIIVAKGLIADISSPVSFLRSLYGAQLTETSEIEPV